MNAFKRKSLYTAVVAGLATVGASMPAGAVNIGTDNTGQVLLYPYYTTRAGYVTSMSIVNTTGVTKAVKVRFLEGQNSAEVLDFNLFLSPRDVWAGAILDNGTGGVLTTTDRSCTAPPIPAGGQPFTNIFYTGAAAQSPSADDGEGGLDRTREGYIEVIEMGVVESTNLAINDDSALGAVTVGQIVAAAVKHKSTTGTPADCSVVQVDTLFGTLFTGITAPTGGLAGEGIIIDVANGTEFAYNAMALANFATVQKYNNPGDIAPNLEDVFPISTVFQDGPAAVVTDTWDPLVDLNPNAIDAVSAVLMHNSLINEYEVGAGISGKTDWVVTMPTKRWYAWTGAVDVFLFPAGGAALDSFSVARPPFQRAFKDPASANSAAAFVQDNDGTATACERFFVQVYDREEAPYGGSSTIVFSPAPAGAPANTANLCYETTVVTFVPQGGSAATASVFSSAIPGTLTLPASGTQVPFAFPDYSHGWGRLTPVQAPASAGINGPVPTWGNGQALAGGVVSQLAAGPGVGLYNPTSGRSYYGLPLIGFSAVKANIAPGGGLGGIFGHKFSSFIQ